MPLESADEPADPDAPPLEHLLDSERSDALQAAMQQLRPIDRALLRLYLDEQSYRDIGQILGLTESNVGARLSRVRRRLSRILQGAST